MKQEENINRLFKKVKTASKNAAKTAAVFASDVAENTRYAAISTAEKVNASIE